MRASSIEDAEASAPRSRSSGIDVWLEDAGGERVGNVEQGEEIEIHARVRAHCASSATPELRARDRQRRRGRVVVGPDAACEAATSRSRPGESAHVVTRIENRLAPGPLLRPLLGQPTSDARMVAFSHRRARLRRLRRQARASGWSRSSIEIAVDATAPSGEERPDDAVADRATSELREVRGPSALGGGTRRFFDLLWLIVGDRVQARLLRHRARLPLVAGPAADAVRRPALRLHPGLQARQRPVQHYPVLLLLNVDPLHASSRKRRPTPSPRSSPRRAWSARPSSRGW